MTSKAHLELRLLGGFEARLAAGAALVLPTKKTQALLAYLALPLGRSHPREKLSTLLWGDMQPAQARGNLRNALSRIKKILPKAVRASLVIDGTRVSLDPSAVDVDVVQVERLLADGSIDALGQHQSGQEFTSIESTDLSECVRAAIREEPLELRHVHGQGRGVE